MAIAMKKLAQLGLFSLMAADLVTAQATSTLSKCWTQKIASYWCVPRDGTQAEGLTSQPAQGYCCPEGSTDDKCNKSTYRCTGTNNGLGENPMPLPLWSTFWPGMSKVCGGSLTGTANDETVSVEAAVIEARTPDATYTEACLW